MVRLIVNILIIGFWFLMVKELSLGKGAATILLFIFCFATYIDERLSKLNEKIDKLNDKINELRK
ncbi:MAG: hypothetical protein KKC11_01510 [Candidatus Omnitrophica bacterium]|nr:hypothetical protein [Candidatus Omnitrophota bacterium]MBU0878827.1 hypothetical protein [Candidatus Omnitrophota bacterium]MBU0896749.1 hypothetical protein [Candidatus Omnitrophota bacterium]MBU1134674.1 hypothetical protein [Candidatus Omnitrophota bacterium]MBU1367402.1 hypothetical protein [Candidatus Omnitrophota bacterium]